MWDGDVEVVIIVIVSGGVSGTGNTLVGSSLLGCWSLIADSMA